MLNMEKLWDEWISQEAPGFFESYSSMGQNMRPMGCHSKRINTAVLLSTLCEIYYHSRTALVVRYLSNKQQNWSAYNDLG